MKHSLFMLELPVPYDVRGVGGPIVFTHFIAAWHCGLISKKMANTVICKFHDI